MDSGSWFWAIWAAFVCDSILGLWEFSFSSILDLSVHIFGIWTRIWATWSDFGIWKSNLTNFYPLRFAFLPLRVRLMFFGVDFWSPGANIPYFVPCKSSYFTNFWTKSIDWMKMLCFIPRRRKIKHRIQTE